MVVSTLSLGWFVGRRLLGMDRETVLLASAGSASAARRRSWRRVPMLRSDDSTLAGKSAVAVATVVLFGTLAMLLYPLIYAWLGAGAFDFGIYVGSTVTGGTGGGHRQHDRRRRGRQRGDRQDDPGDAVGAVPWSPSAGSSADAGVVSRAMKRANGGAADPWFAVAFVALAGVNSLHILPAGVVEFLRIGGALLLTMAMASQSIDTNVTRMKQTGWRPVLLGAGLFVHLVLIGGLVNWLAA